MYDLPTPSLRHARGITPDDGDGEDEHPLARKRTKVQGVIIACVYSRVHEGLLQMHEGEGCWAAHTRLAELGGVDVDHTWLGRRNPHHGLTLEPEEHVHTVRLRLGCAGTPEPVACAACQSGPPDWGAAHATCCALGNATRGHNAATTLTHAAAQSCDHSAEMEVLGLIPGTDPRPLTSAFGHAYTALVISICSPHAPQAGRDSTPSRQAAKFDCCGPHRPSLLRQISNTPIVWSAYGRLHQGTLTVLRSLSKSIARYSNLLAAEVVH